MLGSTCICRILAVSVIVSAAVCAGQNVDALKKKVLETGAKLGELVQKLRALEVDSMNARRKSDDALNKVHAAQNEYQAKYQQSGKRKQEIDDLDAKSKAMDPTIASLTAKVKKVIADNNMLLQAETHNGKRRLSNANFKISQNPKTLAEIKKANDMKDDKKEIDQLMKVCSYNSTITISLQRVIDYYWTAYREIPRLEQSIKDYEYKANYTAERLKKLTKKEEDEFQRENPHSDGLRNELTRFVAYYTEEATVTVPARIERNKKILADRDDKSEPAVLNARKECLSNERIQNLEDGIAQAKIDKPKAEAYIKDLEKDFKFMSLDEMTKTIREHDVLSRLFSDAVKANAELKQATDQQNELREKVKKLRESPENPPDYTPVQKAQETYQAYLQDFIRIDRGKINVERQVEQARAEFKKAQEDVAKAGENLDKVIDELDGKALDDVDSKLVDPKKLDDLKKKEEEKAKEEEEKKKKTEEEEKKKKTEEEEKKKKTEVTKSPKTTGTAPSHYASPLFLLATTVYCLIWL